MKAELRITENNSSGTAVWSASRFPDG